MLQKVSQIGKFLTRKALVRSCFSTLRLTNMPTAVVILPPGAEEMEFVGSVDILRRAGVSFCEKLKITRNKFNLLIDHSDRWRIRRNRACQMLTRRCHSPRRGFVFYRQGFLRCYCEQRNQNKSKDRLTDDFFRSFQVD